MGDILRSGVLPYVKHHREKFYYFGVTDSGELTTFSKRKRRHESNRHAAISALVKKSFQAFASTETTKKLLKKPVHGVHRIENRAFAEVIYITKIKNKRDVIDKFRKKASRSKLKGNDPHFQQLITIKKAELKALIKRNQMSYHAWTFRAITWSTLQTAFIDKKL